MTSPRSRATELEQLAGLVSHVSSSYSTGPVISRTFGPMGLLRDQGFGTVFVAAIRDRGVPSGLLVLAGPDAGIIESEAVQALELLCVLAGVALARIGRFLSSAFGAKIVSSVRRRSYRYFTERRHATGLAADLRRPSGRTSGRNRRA